MGLSYGEDPMIVAGVVLTQYQRVTGGQTDRRTDRQTDGFTIAMLTRCKNPDAYKCVSLYNNLIIGLQFLAERCPF